MRVIDEGYKPATKASAEALYASLKKRLRLRPTDDIRLLRGIIADLGVRAVPASAKKYLKVIDRGIALFDKFEPVA